MKWLAVAALLAACGDNLAPSGSFELVGHADLGARGMSSALAVVGDTVYVGSRNDSQGVAIVDVSDPAHPMMVGEIGAPEEAQPTLSSRELRAVPDLNLLVVMNQSCTPALDGCAAADEPGPENLSIYDITERDQPVLMSVVTDFEIPFHPLEMFLFRDPLMANRVLLYVTTPPGPPSFAVVDLSTPIDPDILTTWDPVSDGGLDGGGGPDNLLRSVGASDDGRVGYFSHQLAGLVLVDLTTVIDTPNEPAIEMITPPSQALDWAPPGIGPHSAVQAPGRPLLVVTEEIYPMPFGDGCPWGHLRTVDITDPTRPTTVGEYQLPEQDPSGCASVPPLTAYTAHDATVTEDLALVSWYAGGLEAIDISDPTHPFRLAEFRPDPLPQVTAEDPALSGSPIEMWSYPVIQNGLIYVVDVRNGLYILRYHGRWAEQVQDRMFLEGNSNLGAFIDRG
ncbi:MAG TPA: hypothetical protein VLX92_13200 [Kofleriaceae bacterium]|nr:hypothetical protein [Kofleriaceae bacterium]